MVETRNVSDFFEEAGQGFRSFQSRLVDGHRRFACGLWAKFPDFVTQNKSIGSSFARGYMANLCKDQAILPPAPLPPFTGGQCFTSYRVYGTYTSLWSGALNQTHNWRFQNDNPVNGRIVGLGLLPGRDDVPVIIWQQLLSDNSTVTNYRTIYSIEKGTQVFYQMNGQSSSYQSAAKLGTVKITRVVRVDGQPDNCGNLNGDYPVSNPQPSDYTSNVTIISDDDVDISLPISVKNNNLTFPITTVTNDIEVTFDLGGIHINNNNNTDVLPDEQPNPLPPEETEPQPVKRLPPPGGGGGGGGQNNQDYNVTDIPAPDEGDPIEEEEQEKEIGKRLRFVSIDIISYPRNQKRAAASPNHPLIFAGWLQFSTGTYNFVREKIEFEHSIFAAPEGATGFRYTIYTGIRANVQIYEVKD